AARAADDEVRRLEKAIEAARRSGEQDQTRLAELAERLTEAEASAEAAPDETNPDGADAGATAEVKDTLAHRCTMARNAEMEARLEVRTVEERLRAIEGRAEAPKPAGTAALQARQRAPAR